MWRGMEKSTLMQKNNIFNTPYMWRFFCALKNTVVIFGRKYTLYEGLSLDPGRHHASKIFLENYYEVLPLLAFDKLPG